MMSDKESTHKKQLPNNLDLLAFHLPILLFGGLVVMPIIYYVLSTLGLLGEDISQLISNYSYGSLIILSVGTLLPSMIAYGRDLEFNLWRFFVGIAIVVIFVLQAYARLKASVSLPLPIGGGFIGAIIASALGWTGLFVRKRFSLKQVTWIALFIVTLFIPISVVIIYLADTRSWDIHTAIKWAPAWGRYFDGIPTIRGTGEVIDVIPFTPVDQHLIVQMDGGETIFIYKTSSLSVYKNRDNIEKIKDHPECRLLPVDIGDRVRFEGIYFTPEFVSNYKVGGNIVLNTEEGLVDVSPCDIYGESNDYGSIVKINDIKTQHDD